jgi:hypothetical protein
MDRREQRFKKRTAVTKEQALNFLCANEAADQNRETHRRGEGNDSGITQPNGAATLRNSDAHEHIAVPKALCAFAETPCVSPCEPLCAILLAKASVYPLSSAKANVSRLCRRC